MRLRQLALAADKLEPVRTQLFQLFGIEDDYKDPGVGEFGLENSVMSLGDSYLEIVAPTTENTAVERSLKRAGANACGYMALFQVDDFQSYDAHLKALGLRQVWQTNREDVSACHIHPKDIGGVIVSFDEMRPADDWVWAGANWRSRMAHDVQRIQGMRLSSPQVVALASHWSEVTQHPVTRDDSGFRIDYADNTFVEFVEGEVEACPVFVLECHDKKLIRDRAATLGMLESDRIVVGTLSFELV